MSFAADETLVTDRITVSAKNCDLPRETAPVFLLCNARLIGIEQHGDVAKCPERVFMNALLSRLECPAVWLKQRMDAGRDLTPFSGPILRCAAGLPLL